MLRWGERDLMGQSSHPPPVARRLAAIVAADVAGYSRLMGLDEVGTAQAMRGHLAAVDPIVGRYGGRIVKNTGDGVLLEFPSIVAAVECAASVQATMAERNTHVAEDRRMLFRIGINLGDVLIQDDDILGDGVNVAARLEGIAEPGGICISDYVYQQVLGKLDVSFEDIGQQNLKNIAQPVHAYRARFDGTVSIMAAPQLAFPDRPSIAVLPFVNMSGDAEQEYFADGMVEDIITALSRFKSIFVIARNSSFTYKAKAVDLKQVGRELGVRYVLEGSVRKSGDRLRITGQLIETTTGAHLWADHFDGALSSVFDFQDEVTERVISAIAPTLEREEIARARRRPTNSVDAITACYVGLPAMYRPSTSENNDEALRYFHRAMVIDPSFATPYGYAAMCLVVRRHYQWPGNEADDDAEVRRLAKCVRDLGTDDATALTAVGYAMAANLGDLDAGDELIQKARLANPNLAHGHFTSGIIKAWRGETDTAISDLMLGMRLSPRDLYGYAAMSSIGLAHFNASRYAEAILWYERGLRELVWPSGLKGVIASYFCAGRVEDACRSMADLRRMVPGLRVSNYLGPESSSVLYRRAVTVQKFLEAARFAGLPE
ncbi:adenylate/guanylate cyclase domain-containing protein [Bradyrhizobium sp. AUGA SZCCT0177]|uniref:adenylate/guanylate cyclase domain-containing protein n=1 Tax=Bradyrhizobium sp. AUGA SZCCT0177 TaxID=2807665 RepID=UPI001BA77C1B|nr:adenylate/guanylate cyclase domain-containing protein [Bradyrhizobium sp. AUGA SZCCT0177]